MKVTVVEQSSTQLEVVIKCNQTNSKEVQDLLQVLTSFDKKILARQNEEVTLLSYSSILYGEVVNRTVFFYTVNDVFFASVTLQQLEKEPGFLRCSKTMVVNLKQITHLKSMLQGKIIATLSNDEKILISRRYASTLRAALQINSKKKGVPL